MKNTTLKIIISLSCVSLLSLILVQYNWAENLINLQKKQFNHKVKIALTNAGYQLKLIHHESIKSIHPVSQISSNSFIVEIQDIANPTIIDSLLQIEFKASQIDLPYKIAIYDCFTDSVVYTRSGSSKAEKVPANQYGVDWDINTYNFGVIFNDDDLNNNDYLFWVISISVVSLITIIFIYAVSIIIKQKQLDEMKNDFINNMTHELKTPISTISLGSDVLCEPEIINHPERLNRYAHIIKDENNRLKKQVERVLQIAFYEDDKIILNIEEFGIIDCLNKAISPYLETIKSINGRFNITGNECLINADEYHLRHMFSNIFDNCIKYRKNDVPLEIKISVAKNDGFLEIKISDNGIGMHQDQLNHIFKKFYRVPTGDRHDVKGFGIGLSYVKLMTEKHKGKIVVESSINIGSTFVIKLPI